jgi:hypothetical protein
MPLITDPDFGQHACDIRRGLPYLHPQAPSNYISTESWEISMTTKAKIGLWTFAGVLSLGAAVDTYIVEHEYNVIAMFLAAVCFGIAIAGYGQRRRAVRRV